MFFISYITANRGTFSTGPSQQRVSQRTAHQRAPRPDCVRCPHFFQTGIDLDQIHGDQIACPMNTLTNEVSLAERQAPADWSSSAGRPLRVQRVDVEGQVDGGVASNVSQGHFDHASDSISEIGVLDLPPVLASILAVQ